MNAIAPTDSKIPTITAHFELTAADFVEGAMRRDPTQKKKGMNAAISWAIFIGIGTLAVIFVAQSADAPSTNPEPTPHFSTGAKWFLGLAPALYISFLISILYYIGTRKAARKPWEVGTRSPKDVHWVVANTAFIAFIIGAFAVMFAARRVTNTPDGDDQVLLSAPEFAAPLLAIVVVFAPIIFVIRWRNRGIIGKRWANLQNLHGPQRLEASQAGLKILLSTAETFHLWTHFCGFLETRNLILLFPSIHSFLIIPKRAFSDEDTLFRFCGILQSQVAEGTFQTRSSGFRILPTAKLAESVSASPDSRVVNPGKDIQ